MTAIVLPPVDKDAVSRKTLLGGPARLFAFLDGLQTSPRIREILEGHGLTAAEQDDAWSLLRIPREHLPEFPRRPPAADAIAACERFVARGMVIARGKLGLRFPDPAREVFGRIDPKWGEKGVLAVLVVRSFLEGCAAVAERGTDLDRGALAALGEAGITDATLAELRALVATTAGHGEPEEPRPRPPFRALDAEPAEPDVDRLRRIYAWMTVWSDIARLVITRKDDLIRLGLASRQPRKRGRAASAPPA